MSYKDSTKETYDEIAKLYIEDFSSFVPLDDFLKISINLLKKRNLLNYYSVCLGAGPGNDAQFLLDNGIKKIMCIDFAKNFSEYLNKRFKDNNDIKIICEDISNYLPKLDDSSISLYVDSFTLTYFSDDDLPDIFSNISRTLVKGGLFTTICFEGNSQGMEDEPYQVTNDPRLNTNKVLKSYVNYFTIEKLTDLANRYGLTTLKQDMLEPSGLAGDLDITRIRMIFEKK